MSAKMIIESRSINGSKKPQDIMYAELSYMLFKLGVNPLISFEIMAQNVVLS